jgi:hypothetical protein
MKKDEGFTIFRFLFYFENKSLILDFFRHF